MFKLRFAILGAAAALALGMGSAVAMQEAAGTANSDSHGDAVASAARTTCPHGANGVHGACVSAIASTEGQENNDGAQASEVKTCKAGDTNEDSSEKAPAKGDKAAKKADHAEDKAEHEAFADCVSETTTGG